MAPLITHTIKRSQKAIRLMVLCLVLGLVVTPVVLYGYLRLLVFLDNAGYPIRYNQLFAYLIASLVAFVFFPIAVAANHRWMWHVVKNRPSAGPMPQWGSEPTAPVPRIPLTVTQRLLRIWILIVGAVTLLLICGPLEVTRAIWAAVSFMGSGPYSRGAFFQLMIYLIMFALLGALFLADTWLSKRHVLNGADRFAHDIRLNWCAAVIVGWAQALLVGLILAYLIIHYM